MILIPKRVIMTVEYDDGTVITHELSGISRLEMTAEREVDHSFGGGMLFDRTHGRIVIEGREVRDRTLEA